MFSVVAGGQGRTQGFDFASLNAESCLDFGHTKLDGDYLIGTFRNTTVRSNFHYNGEVYLMGGLGMSVQAC